MFTQQREIVGGLMYCHHRAKTNTRKTLEVAAFASALIQLLIEKGVLTAAVLDERKRIRGQCLVEQLKDNGMGILLQQDSSDKYHFQNEIKIYCGKRLHLCKATCCRLQFSLYEQDLEEGIVKWDLAHPYMIAQADDGYCRHLHRETCNCTVHQQRPLPCRADDGRQDSWIWVDFANRIVSPDLEQLLQAPATAISEEVP